MQLTPEHIKKFQQIWKLEFGEEITEGYARQRATAVLEMLVLIFKHEANQRAGRKPTNKSQ